MVTTHWIIAIFIDELMYGNVVGVELRTCVVPSNNVFSSYGREKEKEIEDRRREGMRGGGGGREGGEGPGEREGKRGRGGREGRGRERGRKKNDREKKEE